MSKFEGDLRVKYIGRTEGRSQWMLTKPFGYTSDKYDTSIMVPEGFVTDFASVPRMPLTWLLAGGIGQKSAVIHDYMYVNALKTRKLADAMFYESLGVMEVSQWRRYLMWLAVRVGGTGAYA